MNNAEVHDGLGVDSVVDIETLRPCVDVVFVEGDQREPVRAVDEFGVEFGHSIGVRVANKHDCGNVVSHLIDLRRATGNMAVAAVNEADDVELPIDSTMPPPVAKHRRRSAQRTLRPCCVVGPLKRQFG
jgi:hypothetical protein